MRVVAKRMHDLSNHYKIDATGIRYVRPDNLGFQPRVWILHYSRKLIVTAA
jgi:hypothetical protein